MCSLGWSLAPSPVWGFMASPSERSGKRSGQPFRRAEAHGFKGQFNPEAIHPSGELVHLQRLDRADAVGLHCALRTARAKSIWLAIRQAVSRCMGKGKGMAASPCLQRINTVHVVWIGSTRVTRICKPHRLKSPMLAPIHRVAGSTIQSRRTAMPLNPNANSQ